MIKLVENQFLTDIIDEAKDCGTVGVECAHYFVGKDISNIQKKIIRNLKENENQFYEECSGCGTASVEANHYFTSNKYISNGKFFDN